MDCIALSEVFRLRLTLMAKPWHIVRRYMG